MLGGFATLKQWIAGAAVKQALIDDPGKGFDARPTQILLQGGGFMHGRGLRESNEQDVSEFGIAQTFEQFQHFFGLGAASLSFELALVGLAGIEKE